MNPIPCSYDPIDRNAILIRPKEPFYEWLRSIYPHHDENYQKDECNIYLVHERDSNEEMLKCIERDFNRIFVNELNDWNTDEDRWPENRTFKMFSEWFDVELHSMILDMEEGPVLKE